MFVVGAESDTYALLLAGFSNIYFQPHFYILRVYHFIGPERFLFLVLAINAKQCTSSKLAS